MTAVTASQVVAALKDSAGYQAAVLQHLDPQAAQWPVRAASMAWKQLRRVYGYGVEEEAEGKRGAPQRNGSPFFRPFHEHVAMRDALEKSSRASASLLAAEIRGGGGGFSAIGARDERPEAHDGDWSALPPPIFVVGGRGCGGQHVVRALASHPFCRLSHADLATAQWDRGGDDGDHDDDGDDDGGGGSGEGQLVHSVFGSVAASAQAAVSAASVRGGGNVDAAVAEVLRQRSRVLKVLHAAADDAEACGQVAPHAPAAADLLVAARCHGLREQLQAGAPLLANLPPLHPTAARDAVHLRLRRRCGL